MLEKKIVAIEGSYSRWKTIVNPESLACRVVAVLFQRVSDFTPVSLSSRPAAAALLLRNIQRIAV
eukprot:2626159-Rhodomonas_salina.3